MPFPIHDDEKPVLKAKIRPECGGASWRLTASGPVRWYCASCEYWEPEADKGPVKLTGTKPHEP